MDKGKKAWWVVVAGLMAAAQTLLGFGNLVEDDGGPLYGQLVLLAITTAGAVLITVGIVARSRNQTRGSTLIGVGVLPSGLGIVFFWFPPVFLYGVLAIVVVVLAFRDSSRDRAPGQDSVVVAP